MRWKREFGSRQAASIGALARGCSIASFVCEPEVDTSGVDSSIARLDSPIVISDTELGADMRGASTTSVSVTNISGSASGSLTGCAAYTSPVTIFVSVILAENLLRRRGRR